MTPDLNDIADRVPRTMQMRWSTDAGPVILQFPSNLSEEDCKDVEDLFQITFTGMLRRARAAHASRVGDGRGE